MAAMEFRIKLIAVELLFACGSFLVPHAHAETSTAEQGVELALAACLESYAKTIPLTRSSSSALGSRAQPLMVTDPAYGETKPFGRDPAEQAKFIIDCMENAGYRPITEECASFSFSDVRVSCFGRTMP